MAFTGDEGEMIDPKLAQQWIDNYQKTLGPNDIRAEFVGFRKINELMSQGKAVGIRIYYGRDDAGASKLLMVAVAADEANIASVDGSKTFGLVLDNMRPCPPYCPPA
jgi:hypothetical protein